MKKIFFVFISFLFMSSGVYAATVEERINGLKNKIITLESKVSSLESNKLNKTYPIGSIYITTSYSTTAQVASALGGTWEVYGSGKTLVGVNTSDSNFNTVNKTGGSTTNTLSTSNMPSHTHSIPALSGTAASAGAHTHDIRINGYQAGWYWYNGGDKGASDIWSGAGKLNWNEAASELKYWAYTNSTGAHTHNVTTKASTSGSNGSGTAFTNLQPYITVYMYKRTA